MSATRAIFMAKCVCVCIYICECVCVHMYNACIIVCLYAFYPCMYLGEELAQW